MVKTFVRNTVKNEGLYLRGRAKAYMGPEKRMANENGKLGAKAYSSA